MGRKKKLTPAEAGEMAVFEAAIAEVLRKNTFIFSEPHKQVVKRLRGLTPAEEGERSEVKEEK